MSAQNAVIEVKGDKLTITVDLSKELRPSKSGKSTLIATTAGNIRLENGMSLGLNVTRPVVS